MTSSNPVPSSVPWSDSKRQQAFYTWLHVQTPLHSLLPHTLTLASADASFRRYLRIQTTQGSTRIIMDAPPAHENCRAYAEVATLLEGAGVHVPHIYAWDEVHGFMLLSDLGSTTMLQGMDLQHFSACQTWYTQASTILLRIQKASRPHVLPLYDAAVLQRELQLFPEWYVAQHKGRVWDAQARNTWQTMVQHIVPPLLRQPQVWVHRDYMPRNLMMPTQAGGELGVLDFQDALYGPITYDVASLMRDAFHTWEEDYVLDITIRYWEHARRLGLMDFEDWHRDFSSFYRAVDYMALQRHLKVAGIFARLTLRDGKPRYLADAPRFIHYIRSICARYRDLAPLRKLVNALDPPDTAPLWVFGRP